MYAQRTAEPVRDIFQFSDMDNQVRGNQDSCDNDMRADASMHKKLQHIIGDENTNGRIVRHAGEALCTTKIRQTAACIPEDPRSTSTRSGLLSQSGRFFLHQTCS